MLNYVFHSLSPLDIATIGFGVGEGDIFFGDCYCVVITIALHISVKIMCDAIIIGVIFW